MNIPERISALRALMAEKGYDAYVVPTDDNHQSEYVGEHFKARAFITGFTGSAGTAVITKDEAGLWTDGRYFIQAEQQLSGSGVKLFKMGEPGVPGTLEYLEETLPEGCTLGFDGRVVAMGDGLEYEAIVSRKNGQINYSEDLIDQINKGASFAKLAAEKTLDEGSKDVGGILDWQSPSVYTGGLSTAIAGLKKGEMSKTPVQSPAGYHVIKVEDTRKAQLFPKYEDRKMELRHILMQRHVKAFIHEQVLGADIKDAK